jgi:hypothetical protein
MGLSLDTSEDNYLISFPLPTTMNMKRQINMCFFMSMIFILVKIKFDVNINNNEPLKTI